MQDNKKRIYTGLAVAASTVGIYLGVRALKNRRARREVDAQHYTRFQNRLRYAQEEERTGEHRSRGENMGYAEDVPAESRRIEGTRYQPHTQPDRQPIPTTGEAMMDTAPAYTSEPITADDLSAPLAQYLVAFHDMMQQLRMRRAGGQAGGGAGRQRSLQPEDRNRVEEALDRLAEVMPEVSDGDFADNTLEQRMYNLAVKVRDALQNTEYTDDDLFRINGEVRSQACHVLNEVLVAGEHVRRAREVFECG